MKKNFTVNTDMDFMKYIRTVDSIVREYFDDDGAYAPHIGRGFVMTLFYDQCVECEDIAKKLVGCSSEIEVVDLLAKNEKFMDAFTENLSRNDYGLNFANAYCDAMDIVDDKRSSMARMTDMFSDILKEFTDRIAPALTEENLDAVKAVTKNMTGGETTAHALVHNLLQLKK